MELDTKQYEELFYLSSGISDEINEELTNCLSTILGYSESKANGPRTCPSFTAESRRFWVQIRKAQFVNPNANNYIFQNLGRELILSKQIIRFNEIASTKRNKIIKATLIKKTPLGIWRPILITYDETELQKSEGSLKKLEILSIITSLILSLDDSDRSHFHGLSNKSREELVNILQEVKNILAKNNISISEE
ncbi:2869_t:CDS:2 [Dentiscutata heterogama]|uniref:2869_t:CDS:1 n=1 Tax=Dentiscutata heterogama TaxID=1316150 RepID=A0ACA9KUL5_9GLOM|nr:2869_t:CDS:2 [Dentiscutata heterogama]